MNALVPLPLAQSTVNHPLFGNQWLALLAVLVGVAFLMAFIALVGRWLAATHPDNGKRRAAAVPQQSAAAAPADNGFTPEVLAVIASAVAVTLGSKARITAVVPIKPATPSVEMLMQQWSVEGRRQIYSSHQIR